MRPNLHENLSLVPGIPKILLDLLGYLSTFVSHSGVAVVMGLGTFFQFWLRGFVCWPVGAFAWRLFVIGRQTNVRPTQSMNEASEPEAKSFGNTECMHLAGNWD